MSEGAFQTHLHSEAFRGCSHTTNIGGIKSFFGALQSKIHLSFYPIGDCRDCTAPSLSKKIENKKKKINLKDVSHIHTSHERRGG